MLLEKLISLSHYLLPAQCILCRSPAKSGLCVDCQKELPILPHHCPRCAQFLTIPAACGKCLTTPPPFDCTYVLFPYQSPIAQLITELKFNGELSQATVLGRLLLQKIAQDWYRDKLLPELIIPVPLHPQRLRERGFNQAIEIAKPIAKTLRIPLDRYGVVRIKHTAAQSSLAAKKRQQNIRQAFLATQNYPDKHIAVLDDVITTGNTVRELSTVLKKQGAKRIDIWCIARA